MTPQQVTNFWEQAGESRWFTKDAAFDGALRVRFGTSLAEAREGAFEPPRDCRRLVGLSYAAMGILSMAAVAA